jgi:hypothetical protein
MTQNSKLIQPNGDPDLCSKRPEDFGSQPSKPDAKELAAAPKETLPALDTMHEPDAALIAAQVALSVSLPNLDPASDRLFRNSNIALYTRLDSRDGHESVLNRLLVGIGSAAMDCCSRAARLGDSPKVADLFLRNAMKGALVAAELVKTIDNHRGQGQQTVTVGGVYVNSGGQAIVGNVGPNGEEQAGDPALTAKGKRSKKKKASDAN